MRTRSIDICVKDVHECELSHPLTYPALETAICIVLIDCRPKTSRRLPPRCRNTSRESK